MESSGHLIDSANIQKKKYELESPALPEDLSAGLPEGYGDNRLVLMARDPFCFFCYWEFTEERLQSLRDSVGPQLWETGALILRVYDVTDRGSGNWEGCPFFDVEVERGARQWYVKVEKSGRVYQAELGLRLADGRFLSFLTSNLVPLPFGKVSDQTDSQFMAVSAATVQEEWQKFHDISGNLSSLGRGSPELSKRMAQRWEFLKSVFSGSSWTSPAQWQGAATKPEDKAL